MRKEHKRIRKNYGLCVVLLSNACPHLYTAQNILKNLLHITQIHKIFPKDDKNGINNSFAESRIKIWMYTNNQEKSLKANM